jgi:hypothetical protein
MSLRILAKPMQFSEKRIDGLLIERPVIPQYFMPRQIYA